MKKQVSGGEVLIKWRNECVVMAAAPNSPLVYFSLAPARTRRTTMFPLFISKVPLLRANACTRLMFMSWACVFVCVCGHVLLSVSFFLLIKLLRRRDTSRVGGKPLVFVTFPTSEPRVLGARACHHAHWSSVPPWLMDGVIT